MTFTNRVGAFRVACHAAIAMLLCVAMLPHDTVLLSVPPEGALGGGDGSPAEAYSPDDFVPAAVALFLDIINIFALVLQILGYAPEA